MTTTYSPPVLDLEADDVKGALPVAHGGTGATTASGARTALELGDAATRNVGSAAGTVAAGDDARLSDSRTPTAHAASHGVAGADAVTVAQSQVSGLSDALAAKANAASLATVATSGAYGDLSGRPTLGTAAALDAGAASGVAQLDSGGKVPTSQLPALAISETHVVASQAAMLALSAQTGDVAVRTDLSKSFILTADTPSVLSAWQELLTPPNAVLSVFGRTGAVTATAGDYSASDITGLGGAATKNVGTTAGTVAAGDDSRFTDARTPTAHKASHATGGGDALAPADIGAVPTSRSISAGTGLSGGGDLSANRTLSVSYGTTAGTAAEGNDSRLLSVVTQAESTAAPNGTVHVKSLAATASVTDADLALLPKGVGALLGQVPDSTATGGNKRGTSATDWQRSRTSATQVASGTGSTIGGGINNLSSASNATVGGGANNTAGASHATVAGGLANSAVSAGNTTVGGGSNNSASGANATVPGGGSNLADGAYSTALGFYAATRAIYGRLSHASGQFAAQGDAQTGRHVLRRATTDATATILTGDGAAPATTTVPVLPNASAYKVRAEVVCRENATGAAKAWTLECLAKRGANAAATALSGTTTATVYGADSGTSAWDATLVVNTTRGSVEVQVTGEASKTLRWVATVVTTEVVG